MIKLIGFAPDLPPETPGIFTDCENIIPCVNEFVAASSPVDTGLGALDSAARGFAVIKKKDGTRRIFAGDAGKLYEATTSFGNVSKSGGYALWVDDRWRFTQFGNQTIAAAKTETIQGSVTGSFANLSASAPKAAIVETVGNQVFAFNTNDATFGDDPTRWWCSALGDSTDWTPDVATQCVSGQLLSAPGGITAGKRLGDIIVAYKEQAMFFGQYVGAPLIWSFTQVPGSIGTFCQEAVVSTGTAHYFIGPDDFYVFDGTRPQPLNSPLRQWFFDELDLSYAFRICSAYDSVNKLAYWWFPTPASSGVPSKCIVLNVKTGQWGRMDGKIEAAAEYISPGITIDGLDAFYPTIADLPEIPFDSPFWLAGAAVVAAFKTDHKAYTYTGQALDSCITLAHHGDNNVFSTCSLLKPRFIQAPTTSEMLYSYSETDATAFTQNLTVPYEYGWYDVLWSAIWHKFELHFTGPVRISGYDVKLTQDGEQ